MRLECFTIKMKKNRRSGQVGGEEEYIDDFRAEAVQHKKVLNQL